MTIFEHLYFLPSLKSLNVEVCGLGIAPMMMMMMNLVYYRVQILDL